MRNKLAGLILPSLLVAMGFTSISGAVSEAAVLTPAADAAFGDVSRCLTSGKDKKLDVFYLIDNSGSLKWTDPDNERKNILESSIEQLGGFSRESIQTNVAVSMFATGVEQLLDWTAINSSEEASVISQKVAGFINNDRSGGSTDWEQGLNEAYEELDSRGDSCKMLVWFTDGGINPADDFVATFDSLSRLCRPGINEQSLGQGEFGLISKFRKAGIPIFGVMYANLDATLAYWERKEGPTDAANYVEQEKWLMSFMQPLVEGRGQVASVSIPGLDLVDGTLECAEVNNQGIAPIGQANGAFLNAEDPVALAYQFLKLQAQITGGSSSDASLSGYRVPPGTAKYTLLIDSGDWSLTGPEGSGFSASPSNLPQNVRVSGSNGANAITVVTAGDASLIGDWDLDTEGTQVDLFVYSGLTIVLDRDKTSKVLSDFDNTLTGRVVRTAEFQEVPIDLLSYENKVFELTYISNGVRVAVAGVTVDLQNRGEFTIEGFDPDGSQEQIELFIKLSLGNSFADVESQFTLQVQDKNALARPAADTLLLSNLVGPEGVATGEFVIQGPNTSANSLFCFEGVERIEDAQTGVEKVQRLSGFQFSIDNLPLNEKELCFSVIQDENLPLKIEVTNPTQADSSVVAILNITSSAPDSVTAFEAPIRVSFTSEASSNQAVAISAIILLLILGLLIPMLVLALINFLTTRFLPIEGVVRASFSVLVQPGSAAKIVDSASNSTVAIDSKDFKFVSPQGASRSYETGTGEAKARVPFFPLSSTWYEWQAPLGKRLLSSYSAASKSTKGIRSGRSVEISPNMGENWALVLSEDQLLKPSSGPIAGELILYANSGRVSDYQARVARIVNQSGLRQKITNLSKSVSEQKAKAGIKQSEIGVTESDRPAPNVPGVPSQPGSSVPKPPTPGGVPKPPNQSGSPGGGVPKPPSSN